jgi:hypothetical protein
MRYSAFRCEAGFSSTDFSLCAFLWVLLKSKPKYKPHMLKPVLLDRAGLTLLLHAMERANGRNQL